MSSEGADTLYLETTERTARLPHAGRGAVEVRRITIPEHADPEGPRAGYTIDCPACGQWTVLGLEGRVKEGPDGLEMEVPWTCASSACAVVARIQSGRIDAFIPDEEE